MKHATRASGTFEKSIENSCASIGYCLNKDYWRQGYGTEVADALCARGRTQLTMGALTMTLEGHVHVGFEDNIYIRHGELAKSNADLVKRIVTVAEAPNIDEAKPDEASKVLGSLKPLPI